MKNIVMFTRSLPMHGLGGMEVVAWDVAQGLKALGYKLSIITTRTESLVGKKIIDGIDIVFIDKVRIGAYSKNWWRFSKSVFEHEFMGKCDTVFSVSIGAYGLIEHKDKYEGINFILQLHGTAWGEFISKLRTRRLKSILTSPKNLISLIKDIPRYNKFDAIVGIGEQVYGDFGKWPYNIIIDKSKTFLISNGIDNDLFKTNFTNTEEIKNSRGIIDGKKIILTACRLHPQKGVMNCINAFNLLPDKDNYMLIIAGSGPDESNLKMHVNDLNLNANIKFTGALTRNELAKLASVSDLFLFLTDRIEGLPLNILEASASGLPIILSRHVKVFESEHIHLVNPRDYKEVMEKIVNVVPESGEVKKSFIPLEYTLRYAAQKYKDLIESSEF